MNEDLNFSGWIERRKDYFGPYVDHTLREVRRLEAEVAELRKKLSP